MRHYCPHRGISVRPNFVCAAARLLLLLILTGCSNQTALMPTGAASTPSAVPSNVSPASPLPNLELDKTGHIAYLFNVFEFGIRERIEIMDMSDLTTRSLAINCYVCDAISWAPDGKSIVYSGRIQPPHDHSEVFRVEIATGAIQQITTSPELKYGVALSPDGHRAVIDLAEPPLKMPDLGMLDMANGQVQKLLATPGQEYFPAWSPDGRHIADVYSTEPQKGWYVWILDADGTNPEQLSSLQVWGPVSWSPDGEMLAVSSPRGCGAIYLLHVRQRTENQLTNLDGCASNPVWSPSGRFIAFINTVYDDPVRRTEVKEWAIYLASMDGKDITVLKSGSGGRDPTPLFLAWSAK